jgi:hypothetical protein
MDLMALMASSLSTSSFNVPDKIEIRRSRISNSHLKNEQRRGAVNDGVCCMYAEKRQMM